ncbi:MAG TPA: hypothetical protein VKU03_10965, partial [Roseiarcus sp.]|nr:hypothetical protein [Roseiarcus sp.]
MTSVSLPWRRPALPRRLVARLTGAAFAACSALALAGCGPSGGMNLGSNDAAAAVPTTPVQSQPLNGPTVG